VWRYLFVAPSSGPPGSLALNRGNPVSADRLIDQLWGDGRTAKPANALQAQIVQLRRTLGASAIVTSESGYALEISAADLDAARFEDLVAEGRRLSAEGEVARASAVLGDALRLRRGEPLSSSPMPVSPTPSGPSQRVSPGGNRVQGRSDLELGDHNELVGELEALCRDHPLRERLWSCSCWRSTERDAKPKRCGPTPTSVIAWSTSSGRPGLELARAGNPRP